MYAEKWFVAVFWALVSMFSSFTDGNDILLTERTLRGGFSVPSFILWYIYSKLLNKPLR